MMKLVKSKSKLKFASAWVGTRDQLNHASEDSTVEMVMIIADTTSQQSRKKKLQLFSKDCTMREEKRLLKDKLTVQK